MLGNECPVGLKFLFVGISDKQNLFSLSLCASSEAGERMGFANKNSKILH
jgi:hypothetical protein